MSTDLTLVTACVYKDKSPARHLVASCKRYSVPLSIYGIGKRFRGYCPTKITMLIKHLRTLPNENVIYLDCSDTVIVSSYKCIVDRYKRMQKDSNGRLIMAGDYELHPMRPYKHVFDSKKPLGSIWPYPCAGVIMGNRKKLIEALLVVKSIWKTTYNQIDAKYRDNDQGYWIDAIGSGMVDVDLDYHSLMSISLHHYKPWWFKRAKTYMRMFNGVRPPIVHFNGHKPKSVLMPLFVKGQL